MNDNLNQEMILAPFLIAQREENKYKALLTDDGGMLFSNLTSLAQGQLCQEFIITCKILIDYYSRYKDQSVQAIIRGRVFDQNLLDVAETRDETVWPEVFASDEEPKALLTLFLSDECFSFIDKLSIMGGYASPQELFAHIARFTQWRFDYKNQSLVKQRVH